MNSFNNWMRPDASRCSGTAQLDQRLATRDTEHEQSAQDICDSEETVVAQIITLAEEKELVAEENRGFDPYNTGRFEPIIRNSD